MCIETFVYKSLKYFQKKSHIPRLSYLLWGKEIDWLERGSSRVLSYYVLFHYLLWLHVLNFEPCECLFKFTLKQITEIQYFAPPPPGFYLWSPIDHVQLFY